MRLLLDTTYLMPLAGIETDKFSKSDLRVLLSVKEFEFIASPVSIIELKWIIISESKEKPVLKSRLRREYRFFLEFLRYSGLIKLTPLVDERVDEEENRLLDLGVKDYFDRLIFSTALFYADALLTEDSDLKKIWSRYKRYREAVDLYNWRELKRILGL
ncbi:MAG TPA: type II toxin-antitoxin system VapC family toxin [Thermoprotei archaeon]|nr:MAG: hypothetical protein DRJ63_07115 [Thermoprotei archaeon]HDI74872.1 type II toxin-antitoxin system VapC family toxin [Thermoprotei archaeon]